MSSIPNPTQSSSFPQARRGSLSAGSVEQLRWYVRQKDAAQREDWGA